MDPEEVAALLGGVEYSDANVAELLDSVEYSDDPPKPPALPSTAEQRGPAVHSSAGGPLHGGPGGGNDFVQGMGNVLNVQKGMARFGNLVGALDDEEAAQLLATIDADQKVRRARGNSYGAGEFVGNTALGIASAPLAAGVKGAAAAGAIEGGISELNRTGDAVDATVGAAVGAGGGAAGAKLGEAPGWLAQKLRGSLPAGEAAEQMAAAAAKQGDDLARRASREAAELGAVAGIDVPVPQSLVGDTYEAALSRAQELAPGVAKHAVSTPGALRRAAGDMGPQALSDIAGIRALKGVRPMPDVIPRGLGAGRAGGAPSFAGLGRDLALGAGALMSEGAQRMAPGLGMASGIAAGRPSSASAQYSDILEETPLTPADDLAPEMRGAMLEAVDAPALGAYPGLQTKLSSMLRGWLTGEEPTDSEVALMAYRLSSVPGLDWSALVPENDE